MKSITFRGAFVSVMTLVLLWLPTVPAHAQIFSNLEINEQKEVVQEGLTKTMEEQLKLLQMIFINLLDARLKEIERQTEK